MAWGQGANGIAEEARQWAEQVVRELSQLREHVAELVESALDELERGRQHYEFRSGLADADGVVEREMDLPPGNDWMVKRVATVAGAGGALAVYLDEARPENLLHASATPEIEAEDAELYVPGGHALVIRFYNQPVGAECAIRVRAESLGPAE